MIETTLKWFHITEKMPEDLEENHNRLTIKCLVLLESVYPQGKPTIQFRQREYTSFFGWIWSQRGSNRIKYWAMPPIFPNLNEFYPEDEKA